MVITSIKSIFTENNPQSQWSLTSEVLIFLILQLKLQGVIKPLNADLCQEKVMPCCYFPESLDFIKTVYVFKNMVEKY